MRLLLQVVGGLVIVLAFFFGTLFVLDYHAPARVNNRLRASHVKLLSEALEKYRQARGGYPVLQGNPVDDLKKELVDGKFLEAIPTDPARSSAGRQYLYAGGGKAYGILVTLEPEQIPAGTAANLTCRSGVNIKGSGAFGEPPDCPF